MLFRTSEYEIESWRRKLVDSIISRLLSCRDDKIIRRAQIPAEDITQLCSLATQTFKAQPTLLRVSAPILIVGDIHGQFNDLLRLFEQNGRPEKGSRYIFLGDYVDRGPQSIEVVCLLLAYKIKFPHDFYVLRGNHEEASLNAVYGFKDECLALYSTKLWNTFNKVFEFMPLAGVVSDQVFCAHGGIGPGLSTLDQIEAIKRPHKIKHVGIACDLMWADPDRRVQSWKKNIPRNISYVYGPQQVHDFLNQNNLSFICRAHEQPREGGYEYPFAPDKSVLTIFSAPGYEGSTSDGAVVKLDCLCGVTIKKLAFAGNRLVETEIPFLNGGAHQLPDERGSKRSTADGTRRKTPNRSRQFILRRRIREASSMSSQQSLLSSVTGRPAKPRRHVSLESMHSTRPRKRVHREVKRKKSQSSLL